MLYPDGKLASDRAMTSEEDKRIASGALALKRGSDNGDGIGKLHYTASAGHYIGLKKMANQRTLLGMENTASIGVGDEPEEGATGEGSAVVETHGKQNYPQGDQ